MAIGYALHNSSSRFVSQNGRVRESLALVYKTWLCLSVRFVSQDRGVRESIDEPFTLFSFLFLQHSLKTHVRSSNFQTFTGALIRRRYKADTTILEKCITLGPWGTSTGKEWIYVPEGFIKKIRISHGKNINSIDFHSDCSEGAIKSFFGGRYAGERTDTICIDYPDEYLTSISGTAGCMSMSLCFNTNLNCYGPYGCENASGRLFSYDGKGGVIVGFHGTHGGYISSIGFYLMPKSLALDRYSTYKENSRAEVHPMKWFRMSSLGSSRDVGPWGASGGKPWDDGVFNNIKQVRVQVREPLKVIFGIQFKYVKKDGKFILSRLHGGTDGEVSEGEVNLDVKQEYLTGISGFFGPVDGYNGLEEPRSNGSKFLPGDQEGHP
ncbi:hypothetical protein L2E82_27008 [Cichorium intybus]|uniref:Uncharacterized protein n=1 Tax=Cichorium intybus TaxID=13427 RepID=A0ACB9CS30_CICIN|nr:hypothetical protein L2E82_27008 [Cichorium intybus]